MKTDYKKLLEDEKKLIELINKRKTKKDELFFHLLEKLSYVQFSLSMIELKNNTRKKINEALECHSDFLLEVERSGEIKI